MGFSVIIGIEASFTTLRINRNLKILSKPYSGQNPAKAEVSPIRAEREVTVMKQQLAIFLVGVCCFLFAVVILAVSGCDSLAYTSGCITGFVYIWGTRCGVDEYGLIFLIEEGQDHRRNE